MIFIDGQNNDFIDFRSEALKFKKLIEKQTLNLQNEE